MNSVHKVAQTSARGLVAAILIQAVLDYRALKSGQIAECKEINMKELKKFFASEWFEELCELCDIDKKIILRNLDKSTLLFKK